MLAPLKPEALQQQIVTILDKKKRRKLAKTYVVGGVAIGLSVGVLGHAYFTSQTDHAQQATAGFEGGSMVSSLSEWWDSLDDELHTLIRCTVISTYQVEDGEVLSVLHNVVGNSVGHAVFRPVVEESVHHVLPWENLFENGVAEAAGLGLVQGYFMVNDCRRFRAGEMTGDERNASISKRVGITAGAAVGQTVAVPASNACFFATGGAIMAAGAAFGPALVGAAAVGGAVWLGSTILGGLVGAQVGQRMYRLVKPKDLVKDAHAYFKLQHVDLACKPDEVEKAYRTKVNEIEAKFNNSLMLKHMFQCNKHLAWLLEGQCNGALDVLGIDKNGMAGTVQISHIKDATEKGR